MMDFIMNEKTFEVSLTLGISILSYFVIKFFINKLLDNNLAKLGKRRQNSLKAILNNLLRFLVVLITGVLLLESFGINTKVLITSVGAIGVVVGLALQDVLKDLLSGMFIMFENQYVIGDVITVANFTGEVISVGLRLTKLKSVEGDIQIINNRLIDKVINKSIDTSTRTIIIKVNKKNDLDLVETSLNAVAIKVSEKYKKILTNDVKLIGIDSFSLGIIDYKISIQTKPMKYLEVESYLQKAILEEFISKGIE